MVKSRIRGQGETAKNHDYLLVPREFTSSDKYEFKGKRHSSLSCWSNVTFSGDNCSSFVFSGRESSLNPRMSRQRNIKVIILVFLQWFLGSEFTFKKFAPWFLVISNKFNWTREHKEPPIHPVCRGLSSTNLLFVFLNN